MNYSMIIFILGHLLRYEALFLLLPTVTGFIYGEEETVAFLGIAFLAFVIGTILSLKIPKSNSSIQETVLLPLPLDGSYLVFLVHCHLPYAAIFHFM